MQDCDTKNDDKLLVVQTEMFPLTELSYEVWRELNIPDWRKHPCNGWNDPNEGWYYEYRQGLGVSTLHLRRLQSYLKEYLNLEAYQRKRLLKSKRVSRIVSSRKERNLTWYKKFN